MNFRHTEWPFQPDIIQIMTICCHESRTRGLFTKCSSLNLRYCCWKLLLVVLVRSSFGWPNKNEEPPCGVWRQLRRLTTWSRQYSKLCTHSVAAAHLMVHWKKGRKEGMGEKRGMMLSSLHQIRKDGNSRISANNSFLKIAHSCALMTMIRNIAAYQILMCIIRTEFLTRIMIDSSSCPGSQMCNRSANHNKSLCI